MVKNSKYRKYKYQKILKKNQQPHSIVSVSRSKKREKNQNQKKFLIEFIHPTLQEFGNISYVLHKSIENSLVYMFDELWIDERPIEEHFKQSHMANIQDKLSPSFEKHIVKQKYREIFINTK